MAKARSQDGARGAAGSVVLGAVMVAVGALTLGWLVYIGNSSAPGAERAMFRIGLAGVAMLSAFAQAFVLAGGWMVWRALRGAPSGDR